MSRIIRYLTPVSLFVIILVWGTPAFGHERWFVDHGGHHVGESQWLDWLNVLLIGFGLLIILATGLIHRSRWYEKLNQSFEGLQQKLPKWLEWRFVAVLTAAALIFNVISGVFLAPDLQLPGLTISVAHNSYLQVPRALLAGDSPVHWSPALFGAGAQLLLALILLSQVSFLIPGILIIVLALPLAVTYFEPDYLIDYFFELTALAISLIFAGIAITPVDKLIASRLKVNTSRLVPLALPVIRVGLGISLAVVALHNKLLNPNMALSFLDKHYFNFMPLLGFSDFSNIRFVFAAGIVELAVGVLLIFGIATRLVAFLAFFLMSITMAILGPVELSGHLPIMAIELLLIYRGSGGFEFNTGKIKIRLKKPPASSNEPSLQNE